LIRAPRTLLVTAVMAASALVLMATLACGEASRAPDTNAPGTAATEAGHGPPPPIERSRPLPEDKTGGLSWRELTVQGVSFRAPDEWIVNGKVDECASDSRQYILIGNPSREIVVRIDLATGLVRVNRAEKDMSSPERDIVVNIRRSVKGTWVRDPRIESDEALPTSALCGLVGDFDIAPPPDLPPVETIEATPGPTDTPWPAPTPAPPTTQ
jgi:hypothetical protein